MHKRAGFLALPFIIYFWFGKTAPFTHPCAWSGLSHSAAFIFQWRGLENFIYAASKQKFKEEATTVALRAGAYLLLLWDARDALMARRWFIRGRAAGNDGAEQLRIPRLWWQIAALWVLCEPQWKMRNAWRARAQAQWIKNKCEHVGEKKSAANAPVEPLMITNRLPLATASGYLWNCFPYLCAVR